MNIDLRKKMYRDKKDFWRQVREGKIPPPKYQKPVLTAIKLDSGAAILTACRVGGIYFSAFAGNCVYTPGPPMDVCRNSRGGPISPPATHGLADAGTIGS